MASRGQDSAAPVTTGQGSQGSSAGMHRARASDQAKGLMSVPTGHSFPILVRLHLFTDRVGTTWAAMRPTAPLESSVADDTATLEAAGMSCARRFDDATFVGRLATRAAQLSPAVPLRTPASSLVVLRIHLHPPRHR